MIRPPSAFAIPFAIVLILLWFALQPLDGLVGHDYSHAFPRLLIGAAHLWQNGPFSLPHYTSALCGGVPFFADPQNMYFSLPQVLTFFVDPFLSSILSILFFYVLGYVGWLVLCDRVFQWSKPSAHLTALVFSANGFLFSNLFVGHLTHHPFTLIPWILLACWQPGTQRRFQSGAILTLSLLYLFFSGALHILVTVSALLTIGLPWGFARQPRAERMGWVVMILVSGVIFLSIASGKLLASVLYSRHFALSYDILRDLAVQAGAVEANSVLFLWKYYFFNPLLSSISPVLPWEFIGSVSCVVIPSAGYAVYTLARGGKREFRVSALMLGIALLLGVGGSLNHWLPFFHTYHNPIKILATVIPLFSLAVGFAHDRISRRSLKWSSISFVLAASLVVSEFGALVHLYTSQKIGLSYPLSAVHAELKKQGALTPTYAIIDRPGFDEQGLVKGTSSLACYEPVFGYRREKMFHALKLGSTDQISNSFFNLTHPGCFLYPEHFRCEAWQRIAQSESAAFQKFARGDSDAFEIPKWHSLVFIMNGVIFLVSLVAVALRSYRAFDTIHQAQRLRGSAI